MFETTMGYIEQVENLSREEYKVMRMHFLYLVKDGDTPLYAGKTLGNPIQRIQQHLGLSGDYGRYDRDRLGEIDFSEKPESLTWKVEMYTVHDCLELVRKHFMTDFPLYTEETYLDDMRLHGSVGFAERSLIAEYNPCINRTYNQNGRSLPSHYKYMRRFDINSEESSSRKLPL